MSFNASPEISYILYGIDTAGVADPTSDVEPTVTFNKTLWNTQSFSDSNKNTLQKIRGLGAGRDVMCVKNGRFESSITIEANLTDDEAPWKLCLGNETSKTVTATNSLPVFAVEVGYKDYAGDMKCIRFYGCKVNTTKISSSKSGDPVKISLDIFAQRYFINDTLQSSATYSSSCPIVGYGTTFSFGGATMVGVQDLSLDFNQNLKKVEDSRARFYSGLKEGAREYNLSGSLYYSTSTNVTAITMQKAFMGNDALITGTSTPIGSTVVVTFQHTSLSKVTITYPASSYYIEDCSAPLDIGGEMSVMKFGGFAKSITNVVLVN